MRSWVLVLFALLVPSLALAETILCIGDSITLGYAGRLALRRPGDVVVNAGLPGDVSSNQERFRERVDAVTPDVVVIGYGVNDPTETVPPLTPRQSFRNLGRMARYARGQGARVLLLTPAPSVCKFFCTPGEPSLELAETRNRHTRELTKLLLTMRPRLRLAVLDLRDRWHEIPNGFWGNSDVFGLHPTDGGSAAMAAWIDAALVE